jgi:hypothetical protein
MDRPSWSSKELTDALPEMTRRSSNGAAQADDAAGGARWRTAAPEEAFREVQVSQGQHERRRNAVECRS